ncbi:uncharacterized protein LOC121694515 [Alosa sapidissima]|uniref:uncharacterized protein LOC121694515 n=1 Tax=Alosa sapidissima TaxID=34773 RepID=UPI001C07F9FA|nr:uncharacterized protein LOC121694515 [Alosa sapidissima]
MTPMTLTISNSTYPSVNSDGYLSKEQWNIIFIFVVYSIYTAVVVSLTVSIPVQDSGGIFYICKRRKGTYRAETTHIMTPITLTISNTTYPPLNNDGKRTMSKEQWNIIFTIMVVFGSLLCLTVSGGLLYYCKRTKNTYKAAEPEELVYAAVTIHNRQAKQSDQRERQEETVEYGEVNVQRGHTPVDPDQCFSLALYAEVKTRHNK